MAGDLIREVRRATLAHLKQDETLGDLVQPAAMYPGTTPPNPAWPFTRMDSFASTGITASCVDGATVTFQLHAFARPRKEGAVVVETAEDNASIIGSVLRSAIDKRRVSISEDVSARLRVLSSRLIRDGDEEDAWHAILSVEARVLAD